MARTGTLSCTLIFMVSLSLFLIRRRGHVKTWKADNHYRMLCLKGKGALVFSLDEDNDSSKFLHFTETLEFGKVVWCDRLPDMMLLR